MFPPLATLVVGLCVFPAIQAWFVAPEEYARLNQLGHEQAQGINQGLAEVLSPLFDEDQRGELDDHLQSQEDLLAEQLQNMNSPESLQTQKQIATVFNPLLAIFSAGIVLLLEATYFLIAGKFLNCGRQWSEWIGFTLWSSIPLVLNWALYALPTVWSGTYDPLGFQAPLSWIPGLESNAFALTLSIPAVWIVWIRVVGLYRWVERPLPTCLVIALFPAVFGWLVSAAFTQLNSASMM